MRRSVVRLITAKELRDLLRDRRTVLLILVLPAVLYPVFGGVGLLLVKTMMNQTTTIGVAGAEHLPGPASGFPPLFADGKFTGATTDKAGEPTVVALAVLDGDPQAALRDRKADAVLVVEPGFARGLADGGKPVVRVLSRDGDEKSKIAAGRLGTLLGKWSAQLREARFEKKGLPKDFDQVLTVEDPQAEKPKEKAAADELRDTFTRVFPFILMMWLLAGSIQPAVDMTAGEKERGTMETLLISPAERSEIVVGKFLAAATFAFTSVVWNVGWLTAAAFVLESVLGYPVVTLGGLAGCLVFGLPLALLFSGVCLALGVFARSTKEGQYYLMPLILIVMPLAFGSLMPGSELGPDNFWIPVTGAMLLQQKFLSVSPDPLPWVYVIPVFLANSVWAAAALGFAVWQFQRESVLFRETGHETGLLAKIFSGGGRP